ncbi:MAG: MBL fold metallo-hydrolase [Gemmatimonadota bacterium]
MIPGRRLSAVAFIPVLLAPGCAHQGHARAAPSAGAGKIQTGVLPVSWYAGGPPCAGRPEFQVHAYNDDFFILRQSACSNFEKPFLYLLFGRDRALLLDTGAGKVSVAAAVDSVIRPWLARHHRTEILLVVAHSHGHGDHVAGDPQFAGRPGTTVVGRDTTSVRAFFGIERWPEEIVPFDLGDRVLDVIPIPGHQAASIAIYDRRTGVLLTGDTFYPGRLYVRDTAAYARSVQRLVDFTRDRPVTHLLGTHIENARTPFRDYPEGTVDQPDEHVLELTRAQLLELNTALDGMRGKVHRLVMGDFTIWPLTP